MNSVFRQLTQTVIQRFCDLSPIDTNQSLCCTPARDTYAHNRIFLVQVFRSHCSSLTPHHSSKNLPCSLLEFTQYIPQICYHYQSHCSEPKKSQRTGPLQRSASLHPPCEVWFVFRGSCGFRSAWWSGPWKPTTMPHPCCPCFFSSILEDEKCRPIMARVFRPIDRSSRNAIPPIPSAKN